MPNTAACNTATPEVKLPSGLPDQTEWEYLQEFKNRPHAQELSKEQVKSLMLSKEVVHPYKRTMLPVDSDAFRWAVKLFTGQVVTAKHNKKGVTHFECCNLVWIGVKPRQCVHTINEHLRKQLDVRAQALSKYNPTFVPVNLIQYMSTGVPAQQIEQKVVDHVQEGADDKDDLVSVTTQDWTVNEDSDAEPQEKEVFLG